MKKFLIFLAFAAMAAPAFASSSDERNYDAANVLWRKEASDGHNIAELRGFSHFSYAFGVIAKYGLPGSPLLPEGSSNLGFWHIGIVLGF